MAGKSVNPLLRMLIYRKAGEVPRMQYQIADVNHKVILGNVL